MVAVLRERLAKRVAATDVVVGGAKDFAEFNRTQRSSGRSLADPNRRRWALLVLEFWLTAARDPKLLEEAKALKADARSAIERQILELAKASGTRLPIPAATLAAALIAVEDGFALQELLAPDEIPPTMLWDVVEFMTAAVQQAEKTPVRRRN